jgi:gliding motility associated protien GldN
MRRSIIFLLAVCCASPLFAQEDIPQYNPNSLNPIPRYEQLYKVKVWREIRLDEKQNKGYFARSNEITKLIMDAVNSGELADIYANDSLTTKLAKEDMTKKLLISEGTKPDPWLPDNDYYADDAVDFNGVYYKAKRDNRGKNPGASADDWARDTSIGAGNYARPFQLASLRIVEDVIFDKRRSRLYYDIQSITIVWPGDKDNPLGGDLDIATFKYKDLVQVFRNHPNDAIWFNRYNTAENKNYEEAFLLRLFHGVIHKVENPDNETIYDVYSANNRPYKETVWAREWEEMKMMEREHNLWEY